MRVHSYPNGRAGCKLAVSYRVDVVSVKQQTWSTQEGYGTFASCVDRSAAETTSRDHHTPAGPSAYASCTLAHAPPAPRGTVKTALALPTKTARPPRPHRPDDATTGRPARTQQLPPPPRLSLPHATTSPTYPRQLPPSLARASYVLRLPFSLSPRLHPTARARTERSTQTRKNPPTHKQKTARNATTYHESTRQMVFSVAWVAAAARVPAELCQGQGGARGRRRRLRADEVLRALLVAPVRELERLADWLFVFFCLPLPDYYVPGSGRGGLLVARAPSSPSGGALLHYGGRYRRPLSLLLPSSSSSSSSSSMSSSEEYYYYSDD